MLLYHKKKSTIWRLGYSVKTIPALKCISRNSSSLSLSTHLQIILLLSCILFPKKKKIFIKNEKSISVSWIILLFVVWRYIRFGFVQYFLLLISKVPVTNCFKQVLHTMKTFSFVFFFYHLISRDVIEFPLVSSFMKIMIQFFKVQLSSVNF